MKKIVPQLCYIASTVNFVASTIAAICGKPSGVSLSLGGLFLILGVFYSERAKKNNDKE